MCLHEKHTSNGYLSETVEQGGSCHWILKKVAVVINIEKSSRTQ